MTFDLQPDTHPNRGLSSLIRVRDKTLAVGYGAVVTMLSVLFLWSTFVPLADSFVVSGTLSVANQRRTVSHVEGGVVRELKVREGDHVEAVQILLVLNDQDLRAQIAVLENERFAQKATLNRWMAERRGEPSITFDPALIEMARMAIDHAEILQSEKGAFEARLSGFDSQREAYDDRIRRINDAHQRLNQQLESLDRQQRIVQQQTNDALDLLAKGYGTKSRTVELRLDRERLLSRKLEIEAEIDESQGTVRDARLAKKNLIAERSFEAETNLVEAQRRIAELDLQLRALNERIDNLNVRSSIRGVVVDLKVRASNEVVKPAAPILDILPVDSAYLVEAQISPNQIDGVLEGMEVDVRFPSLSLEQPPAMLGAVTMVSADTLHDPKTRIQYYRVHIALGERDNATMLTRVIPGMPTEVTFKKRDRTAFEYFLAPLMRHMANSAA